MLSELRREDGLWVAMMGTEGDGGLAGMMGGLRGTSLLAPPVMLSRADERSTALFLVELLVAIYDSSFSLPFPRRLERERDLELSSESLEADPFLLFSLSLLLARGETRNFLGFFPLLLLGQFWFWLTDRSDFANILVNYRGGR